jgi:hypothetical protein
MGLSTVLDLGFTIYDAYDDGLFDEFLGRLAEVRQRSVYGYDYLPFYAQGYPMPYSQFGYY